VELLGRYSNQAKLREKLQGLLLMEAARSPDEPSRPPKQVQVRLSAAQEVELLERYLAGERAFELAKAYGVDRRTVADRLSRAGVRRPRSMTDQERIDAARLYGQGWSCARIADRLGRHAGTVWLALRSAGADLRQPWERP
jgi:DNA-directed RNA polymerase specialized sigma24 family protein